MDRASIFFLDEGESNTFDFDETLPPLPLPDLHDTLQRYYDTIKPFGSPSELDKSKRIISDFESGIGTQLHRKLKERAAIKKNWLDEWWDKYAYHTLRAPLLPYIVMAMPVNLEIINIPETPAFLLKVCIVFEYLENMHYLHYTIFYYLESSANNVPYS